MSECLSKMGDFNINLLNYSDNNGVNDFVNIIYNNSFRPLIYKPTRITTSSMTLIDNTITNVCDKNIKPGICYNDITDHLPVFSVTSLQFDPLFISHAFVHSKRSINSQSIDSLKKELCTTDWCDVLLLNDVESACNSFLTKFNELLIQILRKLNQQRKFTQENLGYLTRY